MTYSESIMKIMENGNSYFVVDLASEQEFDSLGYEMINQNDISGLLQPSLRHNNNLYQLRYDLVGYVSLEQYLAQRVRWVSLIGLLISITETLMGLESYLLDDFKVFLKPEYILISQQNHKAKLIYLPVTNYQAARYSLYDLSKHILNTVILEDGQASHGFGTLMNYLNQSANRPLKEFLVLLNSLLGNTVPAAAVPNNLNGEVQLIRLKTNEHIMISKDRFVIGSSAQAADYLVEDNKKISRQHAIIEKKNHQYYLTDNNSLNKTYLNGSMLAPNQPVELKSNVEIKCANEVFKFVIK